MELVVNAECRMDTGEKAPECGADGVAGLWVDYSM
jgi:hypothetical protein